MSQETPEQPKKARTPPSARRRIMDLLARREHSAQELREKLSEKYSSEEIEEAIAHARENKWLADDESIAQRFAESLHDRAKGIEAINQKLAEKGLPPVQADPEQELEKALQLAQNKWAKDENRDEATREKIGRYLSSRGFDESIVRKVIYEKL